MACLLITSAGSLVADAILRCLADRRPALSIVGVNSVAAPIAFGCDRLYRVPPTARQAEYVAVLRDVLKREVPDLVLAGRDEDIPALADIAASAAETGAFPRTAFPLPPPDLAPVFADKARTHDFAVAHGLPFAPTAVGGDAVRALALVRTYGFPLIAKPRSGAGSQGVRLLRSMAELERAAGDTGRIIQPFLDPHGMSGRWDAALRSDVVPWCHALTDVETTAELVIGPDGRVVAFCCDQGITAPPLRRAVRRIDDAAVLAVGLAWAEALAAAGHRGPLNIQGKRLSDGRFVPYEVGARFGGTAVARALLGQNLVHDLVSSWLGGPPRRHPDISASDSAEIVRFPPGAIPRSVPEVHKRDGNDAGDDEIKEDDALILGCRLRSDGVPRMAAMTGLSLCRLSVPHAWYDRFERTGAWSAPVERTQASAWPRLWPEDAAADAPERTPEDAGTTTAGALPECLGGVAPDRLALAGHAGRHALPFVPTVAVPEALRTLGATPSSLLVVKPRRGDGPVQLLTASAAKMALKRGDVVAQPALGAEALAGMRALWTALPGLPWSWSVADRVGTVEGNIAEDGTVTDIRSARCVQRGGVPVELYPLDVASESVVMADALRRWGASLASLGHRGPLRLTGQWELTGRWLPFSASGTPLGLPAANCGTKEEEKEMVVEARLLRPMPATG